MLLEQLLAPVFDQRCVGCGLDRETLCLACRRRLRPPLPIPPIAGVDTCVAIFAYDGVGRDVVKAIKFDNRRAVVSELGRALAASLGGTDTRVAVVTWAPTSDERRRARGYDQAELLARAVASELGCPARALLTRSAGPPQTGRSRSQRLTGPHFSPRNAVSGPVAVVDDVVTTGSTLRAAATALRAAGAASIHGRLLGFTSPGL